jgi:peptide/nickel transport system permease protein
MSIRICLAVLRRLAVFALTAAVASAVVFALLSVIPGDPAQVALGIQATPEKLAVQRAAMGLDRPIVVQYGEWALRLLSGDFGVSAVTGKPVAAELVPRLGVTAILVLTGMAVAVLIAVPLGIVAAVRHNRPVGILLSAVSQVGIAVPAFVAGLLLITVFGVWLQWFPSGGWARDGDGALSLLSYLVLPAISLGVVQGAVLSRYVRSAVMDVMHEDYLRTARAKGLPFLIALVRHGLRNAAIPVLTVGGVQLGLMLVGAVVVERVFVISGLGSMLLDSVGNRDMIAVQGIVMVLVMAVLLINFVVDLLYTVIDPRLRAAS